MKEKKCSSCGSPGLLYKHLCCNCWPSELTCTVCKLTKPLEEFTKSRNKAIGRESRCKKCTQLKQKKVNSRNYPQNTYQLETLEWEIFDYFKKMGVNLDDEQVKDVVDTIKKERNLKSLDEMMEKYGADKKRYLNKFDKS